MLQGIFFLAKIAVCFIGIPGTIAWVYVNITGIDRLPLILSFALMAAGGGGQFLALWKEKKLISFLLLVLALPGVLGLFNVIPAYLDPSKDWQKKALAGNTGLLTISEDILDAPGGNRIRELKRTTMVNVTGEDVFVIKTFNATSSKITYYTPVEYDGTVGYIPSHQLRKGDAANTEKKAINTAGFPRVPASNTAWIYDISGDSAATIVLVDYHATVLVTGEDVLPSFAESKEKAAYYTPVYYDGISGFMHAGDLWANPASGR